MTPASVSSSAELHRFFAGTEERGRAGGVVRGSVGEVGNLFADGGEGVERKVGSHLRSSIRDERSSGMRRRSASKGCLQMFPAIRRPEKWGPY